ncbi:MAG: ATP-binding cassette domain-containing protein [Candidatus Micrarchaeota archaeon]|nr:ATP-binding cassette domain-containing protein [Candidatus Micrarchaeota archaeon]
MPDSAIAVKGLVKKYGNFTAVDKVSFNVGEGEIFGLLGPNGAGKTTTISVLSTIISLTSGSAAVFGNDVDRNRDAVRSMIGMVFQDPSLDDELTGRENLDLHARFYGVKGEEKKRAIGEVLKLVELGAYADKQVRSYSGGMKRRLEIARGFIHKPRLLFLDEPTIGLDPQTRRKIWDYIKMLNERERLTIIITTHYMEEADELCDRIGIIDHGKIIALNTPEKLKDSLGGDVIRIGTPAPGKLASILKKRKFGMRVKEYGGDAVEITVRDGSALLPRIIALAEKGKIDVEYSTIKRPTLEDVFISLTGKAIREEEGDANTAMMRRFMGRR